MPLIKTEAQLRTFLDDLEAQRFLLTTGLGIESYHQWLGNSPHLVSQFTRLNNQLLGRKDYAAVIERWLGKVKDSQLARRLDVQRTDFLISRANPQDILTLGESQVKLQDAVLAFRYSFGGKRVTMTELGETLRLQPDRTQRREAFLANAQAAKANKGRILACMRLNDRIGRSQGFLNGADANLQIQGLNRRQALKDLEDFERSTRPMMQELLAQVRRDLKLDTAQAWDIDYWLHQQEIKGGIDPWSREAGVPRLKELMTALGFEPEKRMIGLDVRDVPVGGIAFPTRPAFESRLLTNPFSGSEFYITLFHEYGHALHGVLINPKLPPGLLNVDPAPLSEGVAECLGHFAYDHNWLARAAGVSTERAAQLERIGKLQLLLWLRRTICLNSWVEIRAYDNLNADLDALYAEGFRKFMLCELPKGHFFGMIEVYGTSPLYLTSYLYGNMVATQLRAAMKSEFGVEDLSSESRVGPWISKHIFFPGLSIPWSKKILLSTGKPLGVDALSKYLDAAPR